MKIRSPGYANIVGIVGMVATRSLRLVWLVTKGFDYRNRKYKILPTNTFIFKSRFTLFHMTFRLIETAIQIHVFWFSIVTRVVKHKYSLLIRAENFETFAKFILQEKHQFICGLVCNICILLKYRKGLNIVEFMK